jgi:bacterioferritin-associated ferredoxin
MYVCVCNGITDKQIRKAAQGGVKDLWALQAELGVATNCGTCSDLAVEILDEYRGQHKAPKRKPARGPVVYEPGLGGALPATA